jgi:hypothetical protein
LSGWAFDINASSGGTTAEEVRRALAWLERNVPTVVALDRPAVARTVLMQLR